MGQGKNATNGIRPMHPLVGGGYKQNATKPNQTGKRKETKGNKPNTMDGCHHAKE